MERPVCYDVTRLLTRVLNATPNGIDRIDYALATHFLRGGAQDDGAQGGKAIDGAGAFGATATGFGARLLGGVAAAQAVRAIGAHWREDDPAAENEPAFRRVVAFLAGERPAPPPPRPAGGRVAHRWTRARDVGRWLRRHGLPLTRTPATHLPPRAIYLNASQFPLWREASFAWLDRRPDIRAVFFLHDLLPIHLPEYFRAGEYERHRKRLATFARFGAAALVTTRTVAQDLAAYLGTLGRRDCSIFVAPPPVAPVFATPRRIDPALSRHPYFLFCSTLEPRKNHLMLLAVWRALVARLGEGAPKLVLAGTRGWHYAPIVDLLARSPALRTHVVEVGGLSTPSLKRLVDNAQAVLMASFGEGFGLPVHEALAAGAPVIASDIAAFREISAEGLQLLSPLDGDAWLEAIVELGRTPRAATSSRLPAAGLADWADYHARLDAFLDAL